MEFFRGLGRRIQEDLTAKAIKYYLHQGYIDMDTEKLLGKTDPHRLTEEDVYRFNLALFPAVRNMTPDEFQSFVDRRTSSLPQPRADMVKGLIVGIRRNLIGKSDEEFQALLETIRLRANPSAPPLSIDPTK